MLTNQFLLTSESSYSRKKIEQVLFSSIYHNPRKRVLLKGISGSLDYLLNCYAQDGVLKIKIIHELKLCSEPETTGTTMQ